MSHAFGNRLPFSDGVGATVTAQFQVIDGCVTTILSAIAKRNPWLRVASPGLLNKRRGSTLEIRFQAEGKHAFRLLPRHELFHLRSEVHSGPPPSVDVTHHAVLIDEYD